MGLLTPELRGLPDRPSANKMQRSPLIESTSWQSLETCRNKTARTVKQLGETTIALAVGLTMPFPSLAVLAQKAPASILPADAPSIVSQIQMANAFEEASSDNILLVVLTSEWLLRLKRCIGPL